MEWLGWACAGVLALISIYLVMALRWEREHTAYLQRLIVEKRTI